MSQGTKNRDKTAGELDALYAPVRDELGEVDAILRGELQSQHSFVDRLVKHGFRLGGKRLRPALVLLSGRACGQVRREHIVLAAAAELLHTATLIHDDVLDEATLRRHLQTVNARWDNEASVLLGDYLFARSLCLVSSLGSIHACQALAEASRVMCEGELRQIATRGNYDLSEDDYLSIIADKTAVLYACCCRLGARFAGAGAEAEDALDRYGHQLGIAFQIVDDVLDVLGDEDTTGKSLGTDLAKQKPTLPVIRLLQKADPGRRGEITASLSRGDNHQREALRPWLDHFDAVGYARRRACEFIRSAVARLAPLPGSTAKDCLVRIAEFVVTRQQ